MPRRLRRAGRLYPPLLVDFAESVQCPGTLGEADRASRSHQPSSSSHAPLGVPRRVPETNLWMNFECPPLALRCDRIVQLLDLRCNAPCLLAQPPRRLLPIDRACLCIGLRSQCCSTRCGKYAAATRLTEHLPSSLIARPRTFEQPYGDVYAEAGKIRRAVSQPCREIDHFD